MAVLKKVEKEVLGETRFFENAYHEVTNVSGDKQGMVAQVVIYKDNQKRIVIDSFTFFFDPDLKETSKNAFSQAYESLKVLPEYENAIDC